MPLTQNSRKRKLIYSIRMKIGGCLGMGLREGWDGEIIKGSELILVVMDMFIISVVVTVLSWTSLSSDNLLSAFYCMLMIPQ